MHGNVWEWCEDTWHDDYDGAPDDGSAWIDNNDRAHILRGGSWYYNPENCRAARRLRFDADYVGCFDGFRLILVP
jgi:formylglycine-generating enzyme required for sulfatase activity